MNVKEAKAELGDEFIFVGTDKNMRCKAVGFLDCWAQMQPVVEAVEKIWDEKSFDENFKADDVKYVQASDYHRFRKIANEALDKVRRIRGDEEN